MEELEIEAWNREDRASEWKEWKKSPVNHKGQKKFIKKIKEWNKQRNGGPIDDRLECGEAKGILTSRNDEQSQRPEKQRGLMFRA